MSHADQIAAFAASNPHEARNIFNAACANAKDADELASRELLREFFCNPEFRSAMEREIERIGMEQAS